jgi:hypothetical protein
MELDSGLDGVFGPFGLARVGLQFGRWLHFHGTGLLRPTMAGLIALVGRRSSSFGHWGLRFETRDGKGRTGKRGGKERKEERLWVLSRGLETGREATFAQGDGLPLFDILETTPAGPVFNQDSAAKSGNLSATRSPTAH